MTERDKADQPISVAQIAADDRLLDALGRSEAPEGDSVVTLLAAWRADLAADTEDDADLEQVPPPLPAGDPRRKRRLVQAILGAAAAAVVAVGLAVSAHQAEPGSPLWPVAKVVYPQRAEVVAAEKAIADARAAVAGGRLDDARTLLDTASAHIARVDDRATAARLRGEVDSLLRQLAAAAPPPAGTAPTATTPPPATPAAPRTSPSAPSGGETGPQPGEGKPAPKPSESSPGGLLPDLPLPTPLLPLPTLPLPSLPPILPG